MNHHRTRQGETRSKAQVPRLVREIRKKVMRFGQFRNPTPKTMNKMAENKGKETTRITKQADNWKEKNQQEIL